MILEIMKKKKSTLSKSALNTNSNKEKSTQDGTADVPEFFIFPSEKPKFTCSICKKSFSDRYCLRKHIKTIHEVEPGSLLEYNEDIKIAPFKCRVCETEFAYKRNLKRHLIKYHSQGLEDEEAGNCFCNVEGCRFRSFFINALRTHLTDDHKVSIDIENKIFSSKKEFEDWKEEEEKTNLCLFIKEAGKHKLINGDHRLIYQCHRSGHYSGHGFGKRSFRVKGTCKLGKRCTAGLELTVKEKGDIHEVVYYKTHIWHEPDVVHVNLSASERVYLANKLREGTSIASILQSVKANNAEEGDPCKRIHLLKRKDLVNIENTFRLNNTERHIRKQHKKGQKIACDKIKKNEDAFGEVVSWVIESPSNQSEFFTVKKLLSEKCVEHCGVICTFCDACLHMYSCTCYDYLLFGTMCQHIHAVSLSLSSFQKYSEQQTLGSLADGKAGKRKYKKTENSSPHLDSILTNDKPQLAVIDPKETEMIDFLNQNFEQKLQGDRVKLKEKLNFFSEMCSTKIDQIGGNTVQLLTKIVDSALQVINPSDMPNESTMPVNGSIPITMAVATTQSSISSNVPIYQHIQHPTMTSLTSTNIILPNVAVDNISINQQQQTAVKDENAPHVTVMNSAGDRRYEILPQYCAPAVRKKRKTEETTTFCRSNTFEKRNFYDNVNSLHGNTLINDSYATFDYNTTWQTSPLSVNNPSFGNKWWPVQDS